jgi:hypothetical protein
MFSSSHMLSWFLTFLLLPPLLLLLLWCAGLQVP